MDEILQEVIFTKLDCNFKKKVSRCRKNVICILLFEGTLCAWDGSDIVAVVVEEMSFVVCCLMEPVVLGTGAISSSSFIDNSQPICESVP